MFSSADYVNASFARKKEIGRPVSSQSKRKKESLPVLQRAGSANCEYTH